MGYTTKETSDEATYTPGTSLVDGKLKLNLIHRLSQLTVNCRFSSQWTDKGVSILGVRILSMPTTVTYNTINGMVEDTSNPLLVTMASATDQSYKAILAPVQIAVYTPLIRV